MGNKADALKDLGKKEDARVAAQRVVDEFRNSTVPAIAQTVASAKALLQSLG